MTPRRDEKTLVATRMLHLGGSALKRKRLKPLLSLLETLQKVHMVAHTGNAWEGSPMSAGVLLVLNSWIQRSLRVANVCCFSSALLYGLLYK
jgi:hypothetical protein